MINLCVYFYLSSFQGTRTHKAHYFFQLLQRDGTQKSIAVQYSINDVNGLNKQNIRTMFVIEFPHSQALTLLTFSFVL